MKRALWFLLVVLSLGCGGGDWTCHWKCAFGGTSGTKTYPAGTNAEAQCIADYGECDAFTCQCSQ